jgi:hypothetical protein
MAERTSPSIFAGQDCVTISGLADPGPTHNTKINIRETILIVNRMRSPKMDAEIS